MKARVSWLAAAGALAMLASSPALAEGAKPGAKPAPKTGAKFDPHALDGSWDRPPPTSVAAGLDPTIRAQPIGANGIPEAPLKPEYLAAWKKLRADNAAAFARGEPPVTGYVKCLPDGMPATMMAMFPLEVLQSKGRITIIEEAYNQVRRIYLDETQIPISDAEPGFWGHSIGHWDGDVLRVNTVGIKEEVKFQDVPHSDQMQIDEKIRLTSPTTMEDQITVTDPVYLTAPWSWTWRYVRKPGYKLYEYVCEDNREFPDPDKGSQRLRLLPGTTGAPAAQDAAKPQ
jgi:hypothetical protein